MTPFTPAEKQQLNVLLLHAHEAGDAEGLAALTKLAGDPAAFRAAAASFLQAQQPGD